MLNIQQNIPLAPLTTFKIGGPAKYFVAAKIIEEVAEAVKWANEHEEKIVVLGAGGNVLISDQGIQALVMRMQNTDLEILSQNNKEALVRVGAGVTFGQLIMKLADQGIGGLDFLGGLPGNVGGGIYGNAGWTDRSVGNFIETVKVIDAKSGVIQEVKWEACEFSYRTSIFKKWPVIIFSVVLRLPKVGKTEAMQAIAENTKKKLATQPTIMPCAGCVFQNVKLSEQTGNMALRKLLQEEIPEKEGLAKQVKLGVLPSSWLIDQAGLKGKTIGGAQVSDKHANFIVNTGKATAEDVITLISLIKQQVRDQFGVQLREEVQLLGF